MKSTSSIRKAVVPAAGRGTRLYPLTKIQPKEMMAVGHRPVIQAVIEELAAAGITDILIVTGPGKSALEAYLDPQEGRLDAAEHQPWATEFDSSRVRLYFTRQNPPQGLGHAVACAAEFIGDEHFVVALGDSAIIGGEEPFSSRLVAAHQARGAAATLGVQRIRREQSGQHGIIAVCGEEEGLLQVSDLVEKPSPRQAPSDLAICGRYVLSSGVFAHLRDLPAGHGGEIQVTDAIAALARAGELVQALPLAEEELRLDVGNFDSYSRAFVRAMVAHPQLGADFRDYLSKLVAHLQDSANPDPDRVASDEQEPEGTL